MNHIHLGSLVEYWWRDHRGEVRGYGPPIQVTCVNGPCTCESFDDHINGIERPQPKHWHVHAIVPGDKKAGTSYYNCLDDDGAELSGYGWLKVVGVAPGQIDLFGAA